MRKELLVVLCLMILITMLPGCGKTAEPRNGYQGIDVASPE